MIKIKYLICDLCFEEFKHLLLKKFENHLLRPEISYRKIIQHDKKHCMLYADAME